MLYEFQIIYNIVCDISLTCILLTGSHGQTINPTPENTYVIFGHDARLNCTINDIPDGQKWYKVTNGYGHLISIDDTMYDNTYEIVGTYDLIISSANFDDASNYLCEYLYDIYINFAAELIVLGMQTPSYLHF